MKVVLGTGKGNGVTQADEAAIPKTQAEAIAKFKSIRW